MAYKKARSWRHTHLSHTWHKVADKVIQIELFNIFTHVKGALRAEKQTNPINEAQKGENARAQFEPLVVGTGGGAGMKYMN